MKTERVPAAVRNCLVCGAVLFVICFAEKFPVDGEDGMRAMNRPARDARHGVRRGMGRHLLPAVFSAAAFLAAACSAPPGVEIFQREGCIVCHHIESAAHGTVGHGPISLTAVAKRRTDDWIRDHIRNPKLHKPDIGMPSFAHLSGREINALLVFLKTGEEQ
jgi:cytochrome c2